jgi:hypothetical protein
MGSEAALWLTVDVIGSLALLGGACLAIGVATARPLRVRTFWAGAAVGMAILAADERFSLHERAGRWLDAEGVSTPLGLNHMDDAVLLATAALAMVFVGAFWREASMSPAFLATLGAAAAVTALALGIDAFAPVDGWAPRAEEPVELAGQLLLLAAFARRWQEVRSPRSPSVTVPAGHLRAEAAKDS